MLTGPLPLAKLAHLDGLRGFAALYVVVFHAVLGFRFGEEGPLMKVIARAFAFGHEAVAVFIVLSGYCLTLSATARGSRPLSLEFSSFVRRRAKRILPPYYAALLVSLLLIAVVPALGPGKTNTIWEDSHPAFTRGSVLSHLLLIHNWFPQTVHTVNGPLWSVASEWQIYFLLPMVFIPTRRRFGLSGMIGVAFFLGYAPLLIWPVWSRTAVVWYVALFSDRKSVV